MSSWSFDDDDSVPREIHLTMDAFEKKRRAQARREREKDSITKLYENWVKFLEEHDYATPEQVHNFMGVRPRRRSINMDDDDDEELDMTKSCISSPWACTNRPAAITDGEQQDNSERDPNEELDMSKSCIPSPWLCTNRPAAITSGEYEDDDNSEEEANQTRKGGLSKLSSQLASLKCVAGVHRGKGGDDLEESRQDDDEEGVDASENAEEESRQEYGTSKNRLKGVTFLHDIVDDNNEAVPKPKKQQYPKVDRKKVKQALVELELFSCSSADADAWLEVLRQADPYDIDEYSI